MAHSNIRFGLRIFHLYPRTYPCDPAKSGTIDDPWANNPSIQATFYNFTVYKNRESGVLAENVGNVRFDSFIMAENVENGI